MLKIDVVCSVLEEDNFVVAVLGAIVVVMRQRFSTITALIGQHGAPPHCMDISGDSFVQMPELGAPFTISYLIAEINMLLMYYINW